MLAGAAALFGGNAVLAERCLLRLDWPTDPIADISRHLAAIAQPLVSRDASIHPVRS
jgi:hypothetical protein